MSFALRDVTVTGVARVSGCVKAGGAIVCMCVCVEAEGEREKVEKR